MWGDERLKPYLRKSAEIGALLLLIAAATTLFFLTLSYTLPFVIGFLVAVALWPIARRLERTGASRRVSIVVTLVVVLGGLLGIILLLIVQGAEEAVSLSQALPRFFLHWRNWSEQVVDRGMLVYAHLPLKLVDAIQASTTSMVEQAKALA
ncbi:MAG: AI-2E family transporter, partial [Firmicutes bacterium]|nr:AI-2E family transporter [Bacillota bacterium]